MSFLDYLQSLTDVFKSSIILNHSLHSLHTLFDVDAESVSKEFQMKVLDLKCDKQKQKYTDVGVPDFYKFLSREKYPKLVSAASEKWQCLAVRTFVNSSSYQ